MILVAVAAFLLVVLLPSFFLSSPSSFLSTGIRSPSAAKDVPEFFLPVAAAVLKENDREKIKSYFEKFTEPGAAGGPIDDRSTSIDVAILPRENKFLFVSHKMGVFLTNQLIQWGIIPENDLYYPQHHKIDGLAERKLRYPNIGDAKSGVNESEPERHIHDFRSVEIVRNVYDAMVSGYQYHKR